MTRKANAQTVGKLIEVLKKEDPTHLWYGWEDGSLYIAKDDETECDELCISNKVQESDNKILYIMGYPCLISDTSCVTTYKELQDAYANALCNNEQINFIVLHPNALNELFTALHWNLTTKELKMAMCKTAIYLEHKYGSDAIHQNNLKEGVICGLQELGDA